MQRSRTIEGTPFDGEEEIAANVAFASLDAAAVKIQAVSPDTAETMGWACAMEGDKSKNAKTPAPVSPFLETIMSSPKVLRALMSVLAPCLSGPEALGERLDFNLAHNLARIIRA
jgi:hypothetical protein